MMGAGSEPHNDSGETTLVQSDNSSDKLLSLPLFELIRSYQMIHSAGSLLGAEEIESLLKKGTTEVQAELLAQKYKSVTNSAMEKSDQVSEISASAIRLLIAQTLAPTFAVWNSCVLVFVVVGAFVFLFTGEPLTLVIVGGVCFVLGILGSYLTIARDLPATGASRRTDLAAAREH